MFGRIFDLDNPVWTFMSKVADLMILNACMLVCSIPIVTIGASWTAGYYVAIKMVKKECAYPFKEFFHSFKDNFKQATQLWLIALVAFAILSGDLMIWYTYPQVLPTVVKGITVALIVLVLIIVSFVFPMLSHFENTNMNTIKNAALVALVNIPQAILFVVMLFVPFILLIIDIRCFVVDILVGFSIPAVICSLLWVRIFKKFEKPVEEEIEQSNQGEGDLDVKSTDESEEKE